jgi:spore coat polysaccharide biosynthesis protein SpsF
MRLVAVIACRNQSTRLYAKPLQRVGSRTILDHLVEGVRRIPRVEGIVLAISDGRENDVYEDLAGSMGLDTVRGDPEDVLWRLVLGGRKLGATHVLRATPDCPFVYWEGGTALVDAVEAQGLDYAIHKDVPEGTYYEIISLDALERSHREGTERHRSEFCTLYIFENRDRFRLAELSVEPELERRDIRLTVDWPEDLIVVRAVHEGLSPKFPDPLPLRPLVEWLDAHPRVKEINAWIQAGTGRIW